jgi:hypothetical protein
MPMKCVALTLASLAVAGLCSCGEGSTDDPQVAALKARVQALETANAALEKEALKAKTAPLAPAEVADAGTPADCPAALAACREREDKCEKDPFTGPKYLVDAPVKGDAAKPAAAAKPKE